MLPLFSSRHSLNYVTASMALALSGCTLATPSLQGWLPSFGAPATPTVTPSTATSAEDDLVYCPRVSLIEGAASLRSGEGSSLRHQITIGDLARECRAGPDGSVKLRVGVELRALLGPAGGSSGGTWTVPVRVVLRSDTQTLATRGRSLSVTIPKGETFGTATFVEDNLTVPASAAESYQIEVGLGGATGKKR
jgi:hypothetical protein